MMDWTTLLKSQQADFIKRLKSDRANLLHCRSRGCHSEVMAISGEKLQKIKAFCRQLALEEEQSAPVRDSFRSRWQQQLGKEAIAVYLDELERDSNAPDAVAATWTPEKSIGIAVQAEDGSLDAIRWPVSLELVRQNAIVVCILLREDFDSEPEACKPILAGFLPAKMMAFSDGEAKLGIADLLYIGGLRAYLESLQKQSPSWEWLRTLTGTSSYVYPVAISADARVLASSNYDGSIKLWKLNNGQLRSALSGHSWSFYPVASGGGGQSLASGSTDKKIAQSQAVAGELVQCLPGHTSGVSSVAICPEGQLLISGGYDGAIKVWDLATGNMLRRMAGHSGMVRPIAIAPDGKIIASGSIDKSIKLWHTESGKLLRSLSVEGDTVVSIAISPDGQLLAAGTQDGTIMIWHLNTGELQNTLSGHSGTVRAIAIGADGQTLASGSIEKTIKLWDIETGELRTTLTGHADPLINVVPNPNGQTIDLNLYRHPHPGWLDEGVRG